MPEIREWHPNAKQEKFLSLPDEIFEGLYGGAAGGGKTEVIGLLPIIRKFHEHPRFKGLILRRTFPELNQEMIPRIAPFYANAGASWNDTKKCWTFSSGARVYAGHIEHETDVKKYDSSEWNYVGWDELTSFTKYQYMYLVATRVRTSSNLPAFSRGGTNPGNVGHGWVKDHFQIDKVPSMTIIRDKVTKNLKVFVQAFLTDNPHIDQNYTNRLEILKSVSLTDYKAKKFGDWNVFEGQVFGEFRASRLTHEPENACHVISPFEIPSYCPQIVAIDWGFAAMVYALFAAIMPNGQVVICNEYAKKNALIRDWVSDLSRACQGRNVRSIVIDPSSNQKRGEDKTIFQQTCDAFKEVGLDKYIHNADNDRIGGKMLVHEFLRWTPRPKAFEVNGTFDKEYAEKLLKWQGLEAYNDYLASFREDTPEAEVLPRLQIMETCPVLINTIPQCIYDETNKEDVKEFDGDDPYDTLRYLLKDVDRYIHESSKKKEILDERAKIEEHFERTHDMNSLYMKLRILEAKERADIAPIRRFRARRHQAVF